MQSDERSDGLFSSNPGDGPQASATSQRSVRWWPQGWTSHHERGQALGWPSDGHYCGTRLAWDEQFMQRGLLQIFGWQPVVDMQGGLEQTKAETMACFDAFMARRT